MNIEKFISHQIESQFPAIYREDGQELISLIRSYYEFLETQPNQSLYNSRRLFEFGDIDNTLDSMLLFYKDKYLKDLSVDAPDTRFLVKHMLDLYRRRGTQEGLELFFKMFYGKQISVYYPSVDILRPSASRWNVGAFIQLYPTDSIEKFKTLAGNQIFGHISRAEAIVDSVQFVIVNSTLTPIVSISNVLGSFESLDDIYVENSPTNDYYGKIYGSLNSLDILSGSEYSGKSGNKIGEIVTVEDGIYRTGKATITDVSTTFNGEILYNIVDGGFGFTKEHTRLIVSNQFVYVNNPSLQYNILEKITDQANNVGTIIGQSELGFGVLTEETSEFSDSSIIYTVDRSINLLIDQTGVSAKNDSSPGVLYPDSVSANTDTTGTVQVGDLSNERTFNIIEDIIGDYLLVTLDAVDFNSPPAIRPMSGGISVDLDTILSDAFYQTPVTFGTIANFININPGIDYINDVFAIAQDTYIEKFGITPQILTLDVSTASFVPGTIITQDGLVGKIMSRTGNNITVLPYGYYWFTRTPITYTDNEYNVTFTQRDYSLRPLGFNATINTVTDFAVGKVKSVKITNSGYGYIKDQLVSLRNESGDLIAHATVGINGQGIKEGKWSTFDSHLNSANGKVLQDSTYYQDFSYEISTDIDINKYEATLTDIAHVSGVKLFGKFTYEDINKIDLESQIEIT